MQTPPRHDQENSTPPRLNGDSPSDASLADIPHGSGLRFAAVTNIQPPQFDNGSESESHTPGKYSQPSTLCANTIASKTSLSTSSISMKKLQESLINKQPMENTSPTRTLGFDDNARVCLSSNDQTLCDDDAEASIHSSHRTCHVSPQQNTDIPQPASHSNITIDASCLDSPFKNTMMRVQPREKDTWFAGRFSSTDPETGLPCTQIKYDTDGTYTTQMDIEDARK